MRRFFLLGGIFVFLSFLVLKVSFIKKHWNFWRHGVVELTLQGVQLEKNPRLSGTLPRAFQGYLRDSCPSSNNTTLKEASKCSCIALIHGFEKNALIWEKLLFASPTDWIKEGFSDASKLFAVEYAKLIPKSALSTLELKNYTTFFHEGLAQLCSQWILVGQDLGALIAASLALEWPEGVSRLVLITPIQGTLSFDLIEHPILILWGKQDAQMPLHQGYQIRERMHKAIWREAVGRHYLQEDNPWVVMRSIADILRFGSI